MSERRQSATWIHVGLVFGELICIPAFLFEIKRALGGNELSWAYVFEWPLLGLYAVYVWRKMLRELRSEQASAAATERGEPDQAVAERRRLEEADPELKAWNDYLATIHGQAAQEPTEDDAPGAPRDS